MLIRGIIMLGKLLRDKRLESKLTLKDISKFSGFGSMYLSDIETGKKTPRKKKTLEIISVAYDIPYDKIVSTVIKSIGDDLYESL